MARSIYAEHVSGMRRAGTVDRHEYLQSARAKALRGQDLGQAKLNDDAIAAIRSASTQRQKLREHIKATLSNEALAAQYKVHPRTIEKVLAFETWGHV